MKALRLNARFLSDNVMRFLLLCAALYSVFLALPAQAHELRPAFLSVSETAHSQYNILWKTPALGEKQLALKANFPSSCAISNGWRTVEENKFAIETWTLTCPQTLGGQSLSIGGLDKTLTDVLVRTAWLNGHINTMRLTPDKASLIFPAYSSNTDPSFSGTMSVIKTYFMLGVDHILGGIDHLMFVLAVIILISGGKKLLLAVTAFTVGHSVTLALATLDVVRLNGTLVEILIAMSIVLMAYEATRRWRGQSGLTLSYPWVVTFCFGLLHGFGFAGALREIGLPQADLPAALLFFNLGVEAGQILFIVGIFCITAVPFMRKWLSTKAAMTTFSYTIGIVAVYWTLQRAWPVLIA